MYRPDGEETQQAALHIAYIGLDRISKRDPQACYRADVEQKQRETDYGANPRDDTIHSHHRRTQVKRRYAVTGAAADAAARCFTGFRAMNFPAPRSTLSFPSAN